jgi:hypothetical protein
MAEGLARHEMPRMREEEIGKGAMRVTPER